MLIKFLKTIVPLSWQLLDRQDALHPLRMRFTLLDAMLAVQESSGLSGSLLSMRFTLLDAMLAVQAILKLY
jgi:hypothetical protein